MFKPPKRSSSGASLVRKPPAVQLTTNRREEVDESQRGRDEEEGMATAAIPERRLGGNGDGGEAASIKAKLSNDSKRKEKKDDAAAGDGHGEGEANGGSSQYMEHAWSLQDLQFKLGIHLDVENLDRSKGLSQEEAQRRLHLYGPNALSPPPSKPDWLRFMEKFSDPFMLLLELSALLSFILYAITPSATSNLYVALVLIFIILLTCFMAYYQEGQSAKLMSSFKGMMSEEAMVIRDNVHQRVKATDSTIGDIVKLEIGERVPADVRVLYTDGLKVDNSSFTGESLPVELKTEPTDPVHALHSHNMAFSSAMIVEGEGMGVVVRIGDDTMIGHIARLASETKTEKSTLEIEVLRFVRFISFLAVITGIIFYATSLVLSHGHNPFGMFITSFVVVVIANVPEGLPATVTSCLTVSARRLVDRHVYVKRLDIIEALGSATVVASDKTGTLTQNKMTVSHVWVDASLKTALYMKKEGAWRASDTFLELVYGGVLCNMAKFEEGPLQEVALSAAKTLLRNSQTGGAATAGAGGAEQQYLRSRRVMTDFTGIETQDGRSFSLRQRSGLPPSILAKDFFEEPPEEGGSRGGFVSRSQSWQQQQGVGADNRPLSSSASAPVPVKGNVVRSAEALPASSSYASLPPLVTPTPFPSAATGEFPIRRSISNVLPPGIQGGTIGHGHRVTISDVTLGSLATQRSQATYRSRKSTANTIMLPTCKVVGNPSDVAIFNFCHGVGNAEDIRAERPLLFIIPFNSRNKWMMSVHAVADDNSKGHLQYLKGAPEIVLKSCSKILINGRVEGMNEVYHRAYEDAYKEVAQQGERVLALAVQTLDYKKWPRSMTKNAFKQREEELPRDGFTFIGLLSLVDPPKDGVDKAVKRCKTAGVRVAMITGDHPLTAEAIARKVNIIHDYATRDEVARDEGVPLDAIGEEQIGAAVIMCRDLANYTESQWDVLLNKPELVFARASPQDKLTIVQHLKARGEIVAVTGDGVNDSPALKSADIGIAMGIMGSEVAKTAANVVLMDDNFSSIVKGIEEGRVLFDNLTKTIAYTLTHAIPELVAVVMNIVFRIPLGLTSLMILSIDMLTEICPAISFAWEPAEENVMARPPRDRETDRLVRASLLSYSYLQAGIVEAGVCVAAYLMVFLANGVPLSALPGFAAHSGESINVPAAGGGGMRVLPFEEQVTIATMAATAYYVNFIFSQVFNVFATKTRFVSLTRHGLFTNGMMITGVLVALGIMFFICYVPGIHIAFGAYKSLSVIYYLPCLVSGFILLGWGEIRKAVTRASDGNDCFFRCFAW